MDITIIRKLSENKEYYNYLKENSFWIKILKRNPSMYTNFVKYVKGKYRLRATDRLNNALETTEMITNVLSVIN